MDDSHSILATVIIPAHNEGKTIKRLLTALTVPLESRFQVLVVCNGCTDATAEISRTFEPHVTTIETETPSKRLAIQLGDQQAGHYPRIFIDADVVISNSDVGKLTESINRDNILACAPDRQIPRANTSWIVRWYYDVWECLPQVQNGLFGRGVIGLSAEGMRRIRQLPPMMSDDLIMSEAFDESERAIVRDALVTVFPPRNVRDLLRRRIRANTGNHEADQAGLRSAQAKTSVSDLAAIARRDLRKVPKVGVFVAIWAVSNLGSRRAIKARDFTTWRRDESSRE